MIFPDKIEEKIGFDGVRAQIAKRCHCQGALDRCADMAYMTDFEAIRCTLEATAEMNASLHSDEAVPLGGLHDIDTPLSLIRIPGIQMIWLPSANKRSSSRSLTGTFRSIKKSLSFFLP